MITVACFLIIGETIGYGWAWSLLILRICWLVLVSMPINSLDILLGDAILRARRQ